MKQRRRGAPAKSSSKRPEPKGANANPVTKSGDKAHMEYRPVVRKPSWEGSGEVVESS